MSLARPTLAPRRGPKAAAALLALAFLLAAATARAGAPAGYYNAAEGKTGDALRTALRGIISGHNSLSYNGAKDRLWDTVDNRGGFVQCIYTGRTSTNLNPDTNSMNAEHTWPQSRGAGSTPARSDLHHLFVVDSTWNSTRGSFVFNNVANPTSTSPIGAKVNSSVGFEPPDEYKGDIARAIFYFHVRYNLPVNDNGPLSGSDSSTADDNMGRFAALIAWHEADPPSDYERTRNDRIYSIQNNRNPFIDRPEFACLMFGTACSNDDEPPAAPTGLVANAGASRVDLDWANNAESDLAGYNVYRSTLPTGASASKLNGAPVTVSQFANIGATPGVTYYYFVTAVDTSSNESQNSNIASATPIMGDTTPPAAPFNLVAAGGQGQVMLEWPDNDEMDLAGYQVFRGGASGGPYARISGTNPVVPSNYVDSSVSATTTYYYVVAAVDQSANVSPFSPQASATTLAGGTGVGGTPWINEFHYDNENTDEGEFVEIAGPAGTSLAGWSVVGYNGSGGATYDTIALSGTIPDQNNCFGALAFDFAGMQNGAPDGFALVNNSGQVVQFLSYEGSFQATGGPANGQNAVDVGQEESGTTPVGHSLQLSGSGTMYSNFAWQAPAAATRGLPNTGQTFAGGCGAGDQPDISATPLSISAGETN